MILYDIYKEPLQSIKEFIKASKLGDYLHVGGRLRIHLLLGVTPVGFVDIESLLNSLCYKSAFFLLDKKQRISKLYDHKFYILKAVQIFSLLTIFLNYNLLKG